MSTNKRKKRRSLMGESSRESEPNSFKSRSSRSSFHTAKSLLSPIDGLSELKQTEPLSLRGSRVQYVTVELTEPIEFVTHIRHYRYTEGLQRIPLDLAKMLFRLQKAKRPGQSKTVPVAKQGRF